MAHENIEFADDSVIIYQPRYTDESKSRVRAIVKLPNGKLIEIEKESKERSSSFVRDIFLQYSDEEIMEFSKREQLVSEKKRIADQRASENDLREKKRAATFQAKVDALEIPEVKNFSNKDVLRRLRRARSPFEVSALVVYILDRSIGATSDSCELQSVP